MKLTTTAGLVSFFLALSSSNTLKANATVIKSDNNTQSSIESRLTRMSKTIKERSDQVTTSSKPDLNDPLYVALVFLNSSPSFRNYASGWLNRYSGWHNTGAWGNHGGGTFANRAGAGGFANRAGAGGFANR